MKIKDILNESFDEHDDFFNPEAQAFAEETKEYYKEYFKEFLQFGSVPVFTTQSNFVDPDAEEWTIKPEKDVMQSAGYRGQQNALARAGTPYDNDVQDYNPIAYTYERPV